MENSSMMAQKSAAGRVLIVDDEPLIRWSAGETLSHAGYEVREAADARSALQELATGEPPDVVLLDFRLPDSNDLNLLATIRRTVPDTAVILVTAFGSPEVVSGALELGAFRVVGKPLDMQELTDLVAQASKTRH